MYKCIVNDQLFLVLFAMQLEKQRELIITWGYSLEKLILIVSENI